MKWMSFLLFGGLFFEGAAFSREIYWQDTSSVVRVVEDEGEIVERVRSFNRSLELRNLPGRLEDCSGVYDFPVGVANGNHSYGAVCSYRYGDGFKRVFVCNDVMVGHFFMAEQYEDTEGWKVRAVYERCYGG